MIQEEILNESRRLGYLSPDDAIKARWKDIPEWLQQELLQAGFELNKTEGEKK